MFTRTFTCPFDRQVLRVILRFINLSRAFLKACVNPLCQESSLKHVAKQSTHARYLTKTQGDIDLSIIYASSCKQSSIDKYYERYFFPRIIPLQTGATLIFLLHGFFFVGARWKGLWYRHFFKMRYVIMWIWVWCVREIALIVSWLRNLMPSDFWAKRTGLLEILKETV